MGIVVDTTPVDIKVPRIAPTGINVSVTTGHDGTRYDMAGSNCGWGMGIGGAMAVMVADMRTVTEQVITAVAIVVGNRPPVWLAWQA